MPRISSFPLATICPASLNPVLGEPLIDTAGDDAELGSAVHRAMRDIAVSGKARPADFYLPDGDISEMIDLGTRLLQGDLLPAYAEFEAEKAVEFMHGTLVITGTVDLVGYLREVTDNVQIEITDYKTGFAGKDYEAQLKGYALAVARMNEAAPDVRIRCNTVYMAFKSIVPKTWSVEELEAWWDEFARNTINQSQSYCPGEHCRLCRRKLSCPGKQGMVVAAVKELTDADQGAIAVTDDLYEKVLLVENACEMARTALKVWVEANGPMRLKDGRILALQQTHKDQILTPQAVAVLSKEFALEDLFGIMTISKTALNEMVRNQAKRAGAPIKTNQNRVMDALRKAGAVVEELQTKMIAKKESES